MSLKLYDLSLNNRLILGSALYPSLQCFLDTIEEADIEMITLSLKREVGSGNKNHFWNKIKQTNCKILPNTAGCRTAEEAIQIAKISREIFNTDFIKLEVIADEYSLYPNGIELVKATKNLIDDGFKVLPYCSDDISICQALVDHGCEVLMPLASPIGSGKGILNKYNLTLLRKRFPKSTLIIDAGLGTPSDGTIAMEMGYDGILLNSAIALSNDPSNMAKAFNHAIKAGYLAYKAQRMPIRDHAENSTPLIDTPFWHQS